MTEASRRWTSTDPAGPSGYALARTVLRFAIALRCGGVAAACVAAAVGDGTGISRGWQVAVLGGLAAWAAFFSVVAVRRGLGLPLITADTALVALAMLVQDRIVPGSMVVDETTWAIMLASTAIYVAQLALRPVVALPYAAVVIAAYLTGVQESTSQVRVLFVQAAVVSAMMWLMRRGGRRADAIVAARDRERRRAMLEAARRVDERHHRLQMHDSVLAPLTMIASGALQAGSPGLREGARQALQVMEEFSPSPPAAGAPVADLVERLEGLIAQLRPALSCDLTVAGERVAGERGSGEPRIEVPEPVASAIGDAVREALRNVAAHAGVPDASVGVEPCGDTVRVEVADRGRGFDPSRVPAARRGIRNSIVERMAMAGGIATVRSRPDEGTVVTLRWTRG
ncbi:sensor histidine kinase [Spirillospora sp. NPDC048911]|uniref:sensor histidine kinase n=1 Tax=Spirillospora sp. NPDC048911 TaxID=3364527 RepID=UPI0037125D2F